jgi:hypothetical protein
LTYSVSLKKRLALSVSLMGMVIASDVMSREAYAQANTQCTPQGTPPAGTVITCGIGNTGISYSGSDLNILAASGGMSSNTESGPAVSLEGGGDLVFDNSIIGDVNEGGGVIRSDDGDGIYIGAGSDTGDAQSGSVNATIFGSVYGTEHGVYADSIRQTGPLDIKTADSSGIIGQKDNGISASTGGSSLSIKIGNNSTVESQGQLSGIIATNFGTGVLSIAVGEGSTVSSKGYTGIYTVNHAKGTDLSIITGVRSIVSGSQDGIYAQKYDSFYGSRSGTGVLSIAAGEGSTVTGETGNGILATNSVGTGLTIVTGDNSAVSGFGRGISADNSGVGTGDLSIETGKNSIVSGFGDSGSYGIYAANSGSGRVSIKTGESSILSGQSYGLYLSSGASISIINAGTIFSDSAVAILAASDASIDIVNYGTLIGRVETWSSNSIVTNAAGGTWQIWGDNYVEGSSTSIVNNGLLKLISDPTSGEESPPGVEELSASFTGLDFFGGTGVIDMVNGSTGDTLTVGTKSYSPGGTLRLDVLLNGEDSTYDKLVINDDIPVASETSGVTTIQLNYLTGGSDVAPVDGLVLVESAQTLTAGSFVLEEGPVRPDLFFTDILSSRLSDSGRTELVLERQFKPEAPVLPPPLPPSSVIVVDAEPKLESAMGVPGVETPGVEPGPYVQSVGSAFSANTEGTMRNGAESFSVDLPVDMNVVGVIAGLDRMQKGTSASGVPYAWLVGGFGGYVTSNATFEDRAGSQQSNGGVAGAYAAAAYAQWRFHLAAKADFGVTDMSTGRDSDSATYWAPGVSFNAGYRHQLTPTSYFQPIATLSYVHRSLGEVSLEGTDIKYDDTESLRGRIGFRVGSFGRGESHTIEPWMQASVWHEFLGESQATFTGASGALDFTGLGAGTFAEIGGGVNVLSRTVPGFSGNIRTELSFGDRSLMGLSGKLGLEYRFPVN